MCLISCHETWNWRAYNEKKMHKKQSTFLKQRLGKSNERWKEVVMNFETKIVSTQWS